MEYMVKQFETLTEMEHFLNVSMGHYEIAGFAQSEVPKHHIYTLILRMKGSNS